MNWRHGIVGAAAIAAGIGLYTYVTSNSEPKEKEATGFHEEGIAPVELPDNEGIVSYESPEAEIKKNPIRTKQEILEYNEKQETRRKRPYYPSLPKSSGLEDALEESSGEYPSYYIPPKEREDLTLEEVNRYISEAREANSFKIALSYIGDFQRILESRRIVAGSTNQEAVTAAGNDLTYGIVSDYDEYLNEVIQNCKVHNYDSVYRKVMFMNFFLINFPNPEMFSSDRYVEKLDLDALIYKGVLALGVVESCPKDEVK